MGKRKVKNSLPPAALEKKAQSKRTLLNTAKDRPERRSFLYGPSDRIRTCGILLPKQARYQLRYTRLLSFLSGWSYSPKCRALPVEPHPDIHFPAMIPR